MSSSSYVLQLAQDCLLSTGSLVATPHWAVHCSQPLFSGGSVICLSHSWPFGYLKSRGGCSCLQDQLGMLAGVCATQATIPSALAQRKTSLCVSYHPHWYCICTENVRMGATCLPSRARADAKSSAVLRCIQGVWQQVEELIDPPL